MTAGRLTLHLPDRDLDFTLTRVYLFGGCLHFAAHTAVFDRVVIPAGRHRITIRGNDGHEIWRGLTPFPRDEIAYGDGTQAGTLDVDVPLKVWQDEPITVDGW